MSMSILRVRRTALLLAALLAALALVTVSSWHNRAAAAPYPPSSACTISSSDVAVTGGDSLTVLGSGFPANATVHLSVHSDAISLGSVKTDASGGFTDRVTIPTSITGTDHLIVADAGSTTCQFDPFGGAGVAGVATHRSSGGLASTGFHTLTASLIAGVLLVGGGMLLLLGRRRRQS
jgi:ABC-type transport system substrate-binding protein